MPKAKFPVIDVHTHGTSNYANNPDKIKEMDALNLRVLVDLSGGSNPDEIKRKVDAINASPNKDRFRVFANVNWEGAGGPGWEQRALEDLRASVKNGAIGLKVYKELGLRHKKADGTRLAVDDPALDPVWALCRRAEHPGHHPYRRTAGVLLTRRQPQRALARAQSLPQPPEPAERCTRPSSS